MNSVKALVWTGALMAALIYPFAVMFTTEIGRSHKLYNNTLSYDDKPWGYDYYFGSMWQTSFTLVQVLTRDGWCDGIVRHVLHKQPNMWIPFYVFMVLASFGLMNVIVGVIVENTLQAAKMADERVLLHDEWEKGKIVDQVVDILTMSDLDRSGNIAANEFQAAIDGEIMKEKLDALGVSKTEAQEVYDLLDHERLGSVEIRGFAQAVKQLISQGSARDIVNVEVTVGALAATLDELEKSYVVIEKNPE